MLEDCAGIPSPGNTISSLSNLCTGGSVNLSLQNDTQGLGVSYQWQSSPDGNDPWTDFGTDSDTQSAPVSADTYFRCVVTCGAESGTSTPALVTVFYTACQCDPNPLCAANATNLTDEFLTNVTFAGINNNSGSTGYSDFRCFQGLVNAGQTYPFSADVTNGSATQFTETVRVYIDWNQNNVFDTGETFDMGIIPVPGGGTLPFTGSITVPLTATPGLTHLRVIQRFSTYHPLTGCGTFTFGEVEDYWLLVTDEIPPTANFSVNDPLACVGQCLNFTDLSTGDVTGWSWSFPGSSTPASTDQNPGSICFTSAGNHIISLTVINQYGSDDFTLPIEVFVCGTPGCTYANATNYNASATSDDGSCQFDCVSTCPADLNGDGLVNFADLSLFLSTYGSVCP